MKIVDKVNLSYRKWLLMFLFMIKFTKLIIIFLYWQVYLTKLPYGQLNKNNISLDGQVNKINLPLHGQFYQVKLFFV